ncbi:MAG: hypothetical protein Q4A15_05970 [Prevotellaceae bacterium]|nr:hypothetical protein [Prevotellaceae bacterium]
MEQIKDLMKSVVNCVSAQVTNMENADSKELSEAMDMIKDLAMAEYYCQITKAMENPENVYGEDWNENGPMKKGYMPKMTTNMNDRMYRGYDSMMMPEIDRPIHNMYYTEGSMNNSRYERARRGYEDTKDMSALNRLFDIIEEDMKELKPTMSAQDKQAAHQRLNTLSSMMNV